ncbi:MAG TPA: hypothetical protein VFN35_23115, partial [Ktedonobacteraceae bacterium]|nr:hypothetical protein [Ktedonobacteraceae bacterium]
VHGTFSNVNDPFYGAIPGILLVYALIVFAVLRWERQSRWLWLVACFAIWTILLSIELTAFYTTALGIATGIVGLAVGRLMPSLSLAGSKPSYRQMLLRLTWNWPWYLATLLAASVVAFGSAAPAPLPMIGFVGYSLLAFAGLTFLLMISERMPELLVFPASLAARAIWLWQPSLPLASTMAGYSVLCILIFATQFVWRIVPPATSWVSETFLPIMLGLGGQSLVVLAIIMQGGLSADSGSLVLVGVGALLILALLVFASGSLHLSNVVRLSGLESDEVMREALVQRARMVQQWCNYSSGLLFSLVISWMLSALRLTRLDLITLAPASYILVVTPFINHNAAFARYRWLGQALAVVGSVLLLLPTLWLSFSDTNLLPTMILLGEALALLLLGITTRLRIFVLSSTSLIIVGGLHTLFLPTLGIPPSLALTLLGMLLLAIATSFALARRRLQSAWTNWS